MNYRIASLDDCKKLAEWNHQLIRDEGDRNPMNIAQLEERMSNWLASREYTAVIFEHDDEPGAYALFRSSSDEIYLRQLFVVRHRRRQGIGRRAIEMLISELFDKRKRLTVAVLAHNHSAISFWHALGFTDYSLHLEMMPRFD
ncbi:MAG TPA: GNAT family N-acetyltransferase [Candidatus Binatia bacterium]|jgi:GNAT superfamily N-acetyltransferase